MPKTIHVNSEITLLSPDPDRDAPSALEWFTSPHGRETLLLMGNPAHKITSPTLDKQREIIQDFLALEEQNKQLTWQISHKGQIIGAAWLELVDTEYLKSPAIHIMIGSFEHRSKGIGKAVMQALIAYAKTDLSAPVLYSRHLADNVAVTKMNESLGFVDDGEPYSDSDGLTWQNVKMLLGN